VREIETIGVVGLGKMGLPVARHLRAKGWPVVGYDVAAPQVARARELGATVATSPADLAARSDLVIVLTAFEEQVEAVLFGADGVAGAARPGTVVAIGATISPGGMRDIAKRLEAAGLVPLDIPICRGEPAAEAGKLLITGGGDKAAFDACRAAFGAFADSIHHLGPAGAGQVGKMVNNLILWACISANYEGLKLGDKLGADLDALQRMLVDSSAQNWALETRIDRHPMPWAEKDMMIVLAEADAARMSLPLCGSIKEVIKAIKIERGDW
jgi:3-hydroxyisobutyrate dehydrogenase-like beta-hydroxyacid dehydrogenase